MMRIAVAQWDLGINDLMILLIDICAVCKMMISEAIPSTCW